VDNNRKWLIVVYFMIPILLFSSFLPLIFEVQWFESISANHDRIMLYPRVTQRNMGLMTPVSDFDEVYADYAAVLGVLAEIPSEYIYEDTATGLSATITKLKSYFSSTDRAHVAAHGYYSNTPVLVLDSYLDKYVVNQWETQGTRCKLLFLSACNSMGHDGTQNNELAYAIQQKSGVIQLLGYKNTVDAGGAATFATIFWAYHLWANGASGGISSDDSFYDAKDDLHNIMTDSTIQFLIGSVITGTLLSLLGALLLLLAPELIPWIIPIFIVTIWSLFSSLLFIEYLNSLNSAYNNIVKYGSSVPGLTYPSPPPPPPPGGGGCPFLSVFSGGEYVDEGILDIHNPEGYDLIVNHTLSTSPQLVDGKYLMRLTEQSQHFSEIDQVRLVAFLENGQIINRPLFSATHSILGDVKSALLDSDDIRVSLFGDGYEQHSTSDFIDLFFVGLGPENPRVTQLIFIIEGHNAKTPW
jgi:hypothetical protein